uniref:Uncharacterized protein n=1 Tax=Strombidium inclinatum TaxID=197538 RepID=A0A7S3MVA7_9SPIT|mmetsp:Transcript_19199/g.29418  ORF Transcript_19199/g.29418 Transcript_19199/m.29418 type:complete len:250 (+) Transcript_19199:25-774(+)
MIGHETQTPTAIESLVRKATNSMDKVSDEKLRKNKRPLKMPKDYDFSARNVDWNDYKNDYILRTDAVWEKSKLLDVFYTTYKSRLYYDALNGDYLVHNIRQSPTPTNELEHLEDWRKFYGYTDIDGCIWQFKVGPMLHNPTTLSKFISDKESDSWYMCFLQFQKFMLCNERSPVKIDEAHLTNGGFFDYPCYDAFDGIMDNCGADLFEPMFEAYKVRLMSAKLKPVGHQRLQQMADGYGSFRDRKVLHY